MFFSSHSSPVRQPLSSLGVRHSRGAPGTYVGPTAPQDHALSYFAGLATISCFRKRQFTFTYRKAVYITSAGLLVESSYFPD